MSRLSFLLPPDPITECHQRKASSMSALDVTIDLAVLLNGLDLFTRILIEMGQWVGSGQYLCC